ncbi:MAG: hypothetical protein LBB68_07470 [Treponema sp.]|jgi:hypothetical protein|nr:hypothetical protein [Treponema sp.]
MDLFSSMAAYRAGKLRHIHKRGQGLLELSDHDNEPPRGKPQGIKPDSRINKNINILHSEGGLAFISNVEISLFLLSKANNLKIYVAFADIYAQTLAYGLFAARMNDTNAD